MDRSSELSLTGYTEIWHPVGSRRCSFEPGNALGMLPISPSPSSHSTLAWQQRAWGKQMGRFLGTESQRWHLVDRSEA